MLFIDKTAFSYKFCRGMKQKIISKIALYKLKQFQLNRYWAKILFYPAPDIDNISILLIRNIQNTYLPFFRNHHFHPIQMNVQIFTRWTMPDIHRILHHRKSILFQILPEPRRCRSFFLCIRRQIKEHKKPHNSVSIQPPESQHLTSAAKSIFSHHPSGTGSAKRL